MERISPLCDASTASARASAQLSTEPASFPPGLRFPGLDVLRAISWLLVIVSHTGSGPGWVGRMGVGVFFSISGFLITRVILSGVKGPTELGHFYFRRFIRIGPLYYLYVAVAFSIIAAFHPGDLATVRSLVPALCGYYVDIQTLRSTQFFAHLWSICVEERFYLVWPLALMAAATLRIRPRITIFVLGLATLVFGRAIGGFNPLFNAHYQLDWLMPLPLLAGAWLAAGSVPRPSRTTSGAWGLATVAVVAGLAYAEFAARFDRYGMGSVYSLGPALLCTVLLGASLRLPTQAFRNRAMTVVVAVGQLSYVAYLIHPIFLEWSVRLAAAAGVPGLAFLPACIVCLPAAWLIHRFVERPLLENRPRLSQKPAFFWTGILLQTLPLLAGIVYILSAARPFLGRYLSSYPP